MGGRVQHPAPLLCSCLIRLPDQQLSRCPSSRDGGGSLRNGGWSSMTTDPSSTRACSTSRCKRARSRALWPPPTTSRSGARTPASRRSPAFTSPCSATTGLADPGDVNAGDLREAGVLAPERLVVGGGQRARLRALLQLPHHQWRREAAFAAAILREPLRLIISCMLALLQIGSGRPETTLTSPRQTCSA